MHIPSILIPASAAGLALVALVAGPGPAVHAAPQTSDDAPKGISLVVPADDEAAAQGPQHRVLYLHRDGGTYSPGWDDSSRNLSSIIPATALLPASRLSDQEWSSLVGCIEEIYAPFAITVTDVEPSADSAYIEAVIGGKPADAGFEQNVAGVAPIAYDCSVVERAVTFTFSDVFYSPMRKEHRLDYVCWTVAQESGHALGLDHVLSCPDPMTYLDGCGSKSFQDIDAACGEDAERTCFCGGSTQNTFQHLLAILGPADAIAPTVEISDPTDGSGVSCGFQVSASASDEGRIDRVELWVDGAHRGSLREEPYLFDPQGLAAGEHRIEVRAYDGHDNLGTAEATVTQLADCPTIDDCTTESCVSDDNEDDDGTTPPLADSSSRTMFGCSTVSSSQNSAAHTGAFFLLCLLFMRARAWTRHRQRSTN